MSLIGLLVVVVVACVVVWAARMLIGAFKVVEPLATLVYVVVVLLVVLFAVQRLGVVDLGLRL